MTRPNSHMSRPLNIVRVARLACAISVVTSMQTSSTQSIGASTFLIGWSRPGTRQMTCLIRGTGLQSIWISCAAPVAIRLQAAGQVRFVLHVGPQLAQRSAMIDSPSRLASAYSYATLSKMSILRRFRDCEASFG